MKEPHTALFVAPTGVGKMHLAMNLLENEYRGHFDFIIIICPTLAHNETYKSRGWVWTDPDVIPIEPGNQLHYLIEKISKLLAGSKTLFLINDNIADEAFNKCHQPLLELTFPNSTLRLRPRLVSHQRAYNKGVKILNRCFQS